MNNSSENPNPDPELDSSHLDSLFALARARRANTAPAEFAFETRLMARLRSRRDSHSVWAMVSWRLVPFFAACVIALTVWQSEVSSDANDAATVDGLTNPLATDLWSN
jgi:hypothetical protein